MQTPHALNAARGLTFHLDAPRWRIAWQEPDWLGPLGLRLHHAGRWYVAEDAPQLHDEDSQLGAQRIQPAALDRFDGVDDLGAYCGVRITWAPLPFPLRTSVRAYRDAPLIVFRLETPGRVPGLGTRRFERPSVAWTLLPSRRTRDGVPDGTRTYGHQYTEFALPVHGDADGAGFGFAPHRPPVVEPLLFIAPDGRTLLLAPLDQFHEQIIAVPPEPERVHDGVRCGWHGDLAEVPAGFATELAVWAADSPRHALAAWGEHLQRRHATQRPSRYVDDLLGKLSYWTDNGAVYYYRTERDADYLTTLERVVTDLHTHEVPVRSVQIDSWFYPHEHLRPVSAEGAPVVPPSGMMTWEPRTDLFPDGFRDLQRRLGNLPLTFHSRHFSSRSPYFERYAAWCDGEYAHPADPRVYDLLLAQAASWGAITYEQDWLVESFLRVRGLREVPGRTRTWQEQLDRATGEHGLSLQWCMATPADFFQTVTLHHVHSIRTSGDYRYLFDNGLNWVWFLHTNALARAVGLTPFKDVFLSHGATAISAGEPYAEVEALLSALSTGPVGIGDQLGCTTREIVMRTCREDGVLIKPDVPVAAIDRCFVSNSFLEHAPLVGETYSMHPAGRWVYVASFNASRAKQPLPFRLELSDLGGVAPDGPVVVYDWRRRTFSRTDADGGWNVTLPFQDWDYRILCPLLPGEVTVFGDVTKYATVGDRRVAGINIAEGGLQFDVLGAPDTRVEIHGCSATRPLDVTAWVPGARRTLSEGSQVDPTHERWSWDASTGTWVVSVNVAALGRTQVSMVFR